MRSQILPTLCLILLCAAFLAADDSALIVSPSTLLFTATGPAAQSSSVKVSSGR